MTTQPDITVVLPAYNAAPFIAEAVESILGQTYSNFVLLAMNDGSTDGTGAILDALAVRDSRIRVVHNENRGLVATLNESLALCETDLVARMDADDWCMPDRLRQQKDYMDAHPEVAVCGSSMEVYETGQFFPVPTNVDFFSAVLFRASFAHPTIMYRRSAVLAVGGVRSCHGGSGRLRFVVPHAGGGIQNEQSASGLAALAQTPKHAPRCLSACHAANPGQHMDSPVAAIGHHTHARRTGYARLLCGSLR